MIDINVSSRPRTEEEKQWTHMSYKNKNITKDDYEIWLNNDVTKRFLAEMQADLDDCRRERIIGDHEQMIRMAHERNEAMSIFENILAWKPAELFKEDQS